MNVRSFEFGSAAIGCRSEIKRIEEGFVPNDDKLARPSRATAIANGAAPLAAVENVEWVEKDDNGDRTARYFLRDAWPPLLDGLLGRESDWRSSGDRGQHGGLTRAPLLPLAPDDLLPFRMNIFLGTRL
jgi:hypothetical protein